MLDQLRKKHANEGFTLIELLIVIIILGILATVAIFAVGGIRDRGQKNACKTEYKNIQTALEGYYSQNKNASNQSVYPSSLGVLEGILKNATELNGRWTYTAPTPATSSSGLNIVAAGDCVGFDS